MKAQKVPCIGKRSIVRFLTDIPRDEGLRTPRLTVKLKEESGISIVQKTPKWLDPHQ